MRYKNSICSKAGVLLLSIALILIVMPMANAEECDCQAKNVMRSQSPMHQFIMQVATQQGEGGGINEACLVACMFAVGLTAGVVLLVLAGLEGGQSIYAVLIAAGVAAVLILAILECYSLCGGGGDDSSSQMKQSDMLMQIYGINRFWLAV